MMRLQGKVSSDFISTLIFFTDNVGAGDVSFNSLRGFAAVLPIQNVAEYHLLDCSDFKILKRAKWQSKHAGTDCRINTNEY